jgi:hypothetical protein
MVKRILSSETVMGNLDFINATNATDGVTPIWAAADAGSMGVVTALLDAGADADTAV